METSNTETRLGVCYNVFDGEELLEFSIRSVRSCAAWVTVVYQTVSNWGARTSNPRLREFLEHLQATGLVDELIFYEPRRFDPDEKQRLTSRHASPEDLGGNVAFISNVFYNELSKRELGRLSCLKAGCGYFMSMDTDEFYLAAQLREAVRVLAQRGCDAGTCRMRLLFKEPTIEYAPPDELNSVSCIMRCHPDHPFRLAAPMMAGSHPLLVDPTRRIEGCNDVHVFGRSELEMWHMSFVRRNIASKLENVSNRQNYQGVSEFLARFESWTPADGVLHPHPVLGRLFTHVRTVPNHFDVPPFSQLCAVCCRSDATKRCGRCKTTKYCSLECQKLDWPRHKPSCQLAIGQ
eukprot:TRINITY_DN6467_c0_g1_i1.p1 TRINITY_DN6467_c0_g1~~TRINITY_DN6467_c0_g1_i1.p1  ORF type:complete len:349 (+),score=94.98 TRINITY_DN6467_c0_g1_i1:1036-2082(+)